MKGLYQNEIPELPGLDSRTYESIFKLYRDDVHYTYNLLQQVTIPQDLDPVMLKQLTITSDIPYTTLSYNVYKTINLWWLICIVNNIEDPTRFIAPGTVINVIKPQYVGEIMNIIKKQT